MAIGWGPAAISVTPRHSVPSSPRLMDNCVAESAYGAARASIVIIRLNPSSVV